MVVTLVWVRDHYDKNKDRYIDRYEVSPASYDLAVGTITQEQLDAVEAAWEDGTLLPAYPDEHAVSFVLPRDATLTVI